MARKQIVTYLESPQIKRIAALAERHGVSTAHILREAVSLYLERVEVIDPRSRSTAGFVANPSDDLLADLKKAGYGFLERSS